MIYISFIIGLDVVGSYKVDVVGLVIGPIVIGAAVIGPNEVKR
jgi:hypothetical protein